MVKHSKVFIIAAEVSGDVLGAEIMRAAHSKGGVEFVGLGGQAMQAAGLKSIFPISDLAVMGIGEVIAKSKTILRRIKHTADAIVAAKPDIVLTIDSSSFAVRVIKQVKKALPGGVFFDKKHLLRTDGPKDLNVRKTKAQDFLFSQGLRPVENKKGVFYQNTPHQAVPKFYHFVAPMVWAWGAWRAKKYAGVWDKLFCFFDFERPYFEKYGLKTESVGYPIYDVASRAIKKTEKKYLTLLPGSRMGEAKKLMPIYKKIIAAMPGERFAIPTTEPTHEFVKRETANLPVKLVPFAKRYELYNQTKTAIAMSGTAVSELAIMRVPTIVVARANWITALLARVLLRVKYLSLINVLAGREIFPEFLGRAANAKNILAALGAIDAKKIASELAAADKLWHHGRRAPAEIIAAELTK
ncbi:MAG: hypothetical protein LBL46_00930 [Rickettsiales bacterium]|nr:hypothetical protein [Rickettsiales bacterium]